MAYKYKEDKKKYAQEYFKKNSAFLNEQGRIRRINNIERYKERDSNYYQTHKEACKESAKKWRQNNLILAKKQSREYHRNNRDKVNKSIQKRYKKFRSQILDYLGRQCIWCGFNTDERILQLDHINDDGFLARKKYHGGQTEIAYYVKHLDECVLNLQVLCANCNSAKKFDLLELQKMIT